VSARTHPPQNAAWESTKDIPGITYRRLDHWCTRGYIRCGFETGEAGTGHWRTLDGAEVHVVELMVALVHAGVVPAVAATLARQLAGGGVGTLGAFQVTAGAGVGR